MTKYTIESLIESAGKGDPVYINTVRDVFSSLNSQDTHLLECSLKLMDGEHFRLFTFSIPSDLKNPAVRRLSSDYLKAEIYNILSSLGGQELTLYIDRTEMDLDHIVHEVRGDFGIEESRKDRKGYGRCINVIDRMLEAMVPGDIQFSFCIQDLSSRPELADYEESVRSEPGVFARPVQELKDKKILGVDIGGTDIKLALVGDGRIQALKEFDWFPAMFEESRQLVEPVVILARLLAVYQAVSLSERDIPEALRIKLMEAMKQEAEPWFMDEVCEELEPHLEPDHMLFDGIGLCFPDVVIKDKVVGGEVYKTRGIRNNPKIDYEDDFRKLTHLNEALGRFCRCPEAVSFTNDGPMAAFTAAVEQAASGDADSVKEGFFAHTLGTELGTGWVREDGSIPDIPLEVYNCVVDLGSHREREFDPDDLRSVRNFNTDLSGTLQKFASQSGVFRLAMKYFPGSCQDLFIELIEKGFVYTQVTTQGVRYLVPTEHPDMRKPFLEHMMALLEDKGDDINQKIWFEIGASLGVALVETGRLLRPRSKKRILFGRLVKRKACFEAMERGARSIVPDISFEIADSGMAHTPLMKQLEESRDYTVAQFAQAVGAVYFAVDGILRKSVYTARSKENEYVKES